LEPQSPPFKTWGAAGGVVLSPLVSSP